MEIKVCENHSNNGMDNHCLIENLSHNNPEIRKKAALTLEKKKESRAIIPLLNTYFNGSSYVIPRILGEIGKKHIRLLLEIALNNNNKTRLRQYAIEGLGKIGDKSTLIELYKLLKDKSIYIRKSVVIALADIGDKSSAKILLDLLDKKNKWIKHNIIWTLGILGDFQCVDKLIKMLTNKNLKFIIKKNIVVALGRLGHKRAVDILIDILNDPNSGLEDYASFALEKIGDKRAILPLVKKYLNPVWFLKEHYESLLNKFSPHWRYLLKDYECKIYRREDLPAEFFENVKDCYEWHYGYLNKSHYILNGFNKIIGCLNLIFLSIYDGTYIFYWDTIEIKENYRRLRLGTKLTEYMIKNEVFSTLGFVPVKLRKTNVGTHCIMSYPYNENSESNCRRMFEYFNWREEKKEIISSDCKYAYNPNPTGLYWCAKKNIYVTGLEKQNCPYYVKEKEIYSEKKILNLKEIICSS